MSGTNVLPSGPSLLAGAHQFVARDNTFIEAQTVSGMLTKGISLIVFDMFQVHVHDNCGNRTTSDGIISLMPNPSSRFTGRTEVIAKLKRHFSTKTSEAVQKRKFFLLYGMGGIGKTQICLKFVEDMSDR